MSKVKQLISLFLVTVIMLSYQTLNAQVTTSSINGTVVDQNGAALVGASVIAVHVPSGTQYGTTARNDGKYNLFGLRVGGPYKLTVSFIGYNTQVEEGFNLELGQNLKINFKLPEQAVQLAGVTVSAERGAVLSQARTGAAQNISSKTIEEIPIFNRTFQNYAKATPLFSGTDLSAAGRSAKYNNIQLDGTQYNDMFGLGSTGTPGGQVGTSPVSLDAVREFQVVVAPFDVRLSGFTGGGINAITRSGTNQFLGSAFGFFRNQSLVGNYGNVDKGMATTPTDVEKRSVPDFKEYQVGFRLGGPIMKDKLFFFLTGEITSKDDPTPNASLTQGDPTVIAGYQAKVDQFTSTMKKYGYDPGTAGSFTRQQPSTKLLLKFDYNLSDNHKLTLRHNLVDAYSDILGNRSSVNSMSFDTYNYRIKSNTNSSVLQLNSTFSNSMSNELILGYTRIRDRRAGTSSAAPEILVRDGGYALSAGPDQYSSANELDQDVFEFTDNFTYLSGDHVFTVGTHNEFFSFRNLFNRAAFGYYEFSSLADFNNGLPSFYLRRYSLLPVGNPDPKLSAEFSVRQFGFYVQDEWTVLPNFKVTVGIRADIPTFPTMPTQNDSVSKYFPGFSTTTVPKTNPLWSPRVGLNYDYSGDRSGQLRGGIGIFTGKVPYVWISNNYGNTGVLYAEVRNGATPGKLAFSMDPNNQPKAGDPGTGAARKQAEIDLTDQDLKLPQLLRFNLGLDQQLPWWEFIGTIDFQYSWSLNDMVYKKINIGKAIGTVAGTGSGADGRPIWGGTDSKNGNFFDVFQIYNTSSGYQWNLAFQVQRNVVRGLSVNAAYVFGEAKDRNSVNSSQAVSQMRYNPVPNDANTPPLATAQYQIDNRLFAQVSYAWEFFKNAPTTISIFYNGQTGSPFSFIYRGDLNNDGFDSNDLFYVPRNSSEILLGSIVSNQFVADTKAGTTYKDLDAFIENNPYLRQNRGKISERNGARNPWNEYLDLRIAQEIPDLWGLGRFTVTLDLRNVLNLLNSEWGWREDLFSTYQIVTYKGRITYNGIPNVPVFQFSKPGRNVPWSISDDSSRWGIQLGLRYTFGF